MEGVGRLGRSSARFANTTVFTGPVRKWKKTWVDLPRLNSTKNQTVAGTNNTSHHLLLFKWEPISTDLNDDASNDANANLNNDGTSSAQEPPKKKFKYIPVIALEEQTDEPLEVNDDAKLETGTTNVSLISTDRSDETPDINDVPIDENQDSGNNPLEGQDLNVNSLDLSSGFNDDDENESSSKADEDEPSE